MSSTTPVWVTGTGVMSCAGETPGDLWQSAIHNKTGIKDGLGRVGSQGALSFSMEVIHQAMHSAGWTELKSTDGLILATTTGQIPLWDKELLKYLKAEIPRDEFDRAFVHQPLGHLLDLVSQELKHSGKSLLVASACAAATQAIGLASAWIKSGRVERCLVVGVENLCTLTIEGFKCLQLLSQAPAAPFDVNRSGINLSEGAAALCLEARPIEHLKLARVSGYGWSTDSYHMTAPNPEGKGCLVAMTAALRSADLQATEIDWVHAHGTGSQHNDIAEGIAIQSLFQQHQPWVSSTKWVHGHALGASGAIEAVLCIESFKQQMLLKTGGLVSPDPAIPITHALEHRRAPVRHILKNTLGFGGTNAALVFSAPDSQGGR